MARVSNPIEIQGLVKAFATVRALDGRLVPACDLPYLRTALLAVAAVLSATGQLLFRRRDLEVR